ncbi:MAG: sigma-70 family RNA polymerase sigma factor [Ruminococcaceae bacterium]|nr:sigma-70 family RNA polymerase sigma factor [Oscillospiraceae bacterium]
MMVYLSLLSTPEEQSKFAALYERYHLLMLRAARRLLPSEADAEDAVHQAFLSVLSNLEKISEIDCPKTRAYLVIIVERKAIDLLRQQKRVTELDDSVPGLHVPPPGDGGLADAMASLSAPYREVLLLRYYHGYSVREIAALLHDRESAVQKRLQRAKNALRDKLREMEEV